MQSAFAANLKYFYNEEASKAQFVVINSKNIILLNYDEYDKELEVVLTHKSYDFKVNTADEADKIIIKLMDDTDKSLVVLKKS